MLSDEELFKRVNKDNLPVHVGLILDGNRRWATEKGMNPLKGHTIGFDILKDIIRFAIKLGIKHLSLYTLSMENLKRSQTEVNHLFFLLKKGLGELRKDKELKKNEVKIKVLGRLNLLPKNLQSEISKIHQETKDYSKYVVNFCIAYDGQDEIVDAVKSIIDEGLSSSSIDRAVIKDHLYTKELPPLDLIVRTGMGDAARISGFLLWDASYAEFKFRNEYWPDYTKELLVEDLNEYSTRHRRFGK